MLKTIKTSVLIIAIACTVFAAGYFAGSGIGDRLIEQLQHNHSIQLAELERHLNDARSDSERLRNGIAGAVTAIDTSTSQLETSIAIAGRLGSVSGQLRAIAESIRGHVANLEQAVMVLENLNRGDDSGNGSGTDN